MPEGRPPSDRSGDLAGLPIAITGASSGIGRATALACAGAGMPVAVLARRDDRLRELVEQIRAGGGRAVAVAGDVTSPADCERLVERTVAEFGSIHAVFANAGYGLKKPIADTTDAEMRAIFETNFFGTLNTIAPALPRLLEARRGHVLICTSALSKIPAPYSGAYSATKAAQDHVGRALRLELAGTGVRVSTVHPIFTESEFFDVSVERSGAARAVVRRPRALQQPAERVARAIVRCLRRPRPEVWTSTTTRLVFALFTAFPRLADAALRGYAARAERAEARA